MVWSLLLAAGCFRPDIPDGTLRCGTNAACPDGLACGMDGLCYRKSALDKMDFSTVFRGNGLLGARDFSGMTGTVAFDTETGEILLVAPGGTTDTLLAKDDPKVTAGGFQHLQQANGPSVGIWSFTSLAVPSGISVVPTSDSISVPVWAVTGSLVLDGSIDWTGYGGVQGAPRMVAQGAPAGTANAMPGGGDGSGGGGGGYAVNGENGNGVTGGAGGHMYGSEMVDPVAFGAGGAGGGGAANASPGGGGSGGGALALFAKTVEIGGLISVAGADGSPGGLNPPAASGGGGGGSGGSLLVSADQVSFGVSASLVATGGKGGAGSGGGMPGGAGADGRIWIGSMTAAGNIPSAPQATSASGTMGVINSFPR
jgi:hypothetical protein